MTMQKKQRNIEGNVLFWRIQDICLITRQTQRAGGSNRDTIREKTDGELQVGIRKSLEKQRKKNKMQERWKLVRESIERGRKIKKKKTWEGIEGEM